ncbi:MAG: 4-oxalocrotonate tautomerase [Lachnospiraceae bacterium]|jgi:4-oxalocrotonate tautomerase|nr:4-oxalocrotonate tautomerase [Lachnospiraceae bacterium]
MPHIAVKLWPGRKEEAKENLAKKIVNVVVEELNVDAGAVSVAIEEVKQSDWEEQIYKKEIKDNSNIYVKPDYEYE